MSVKVFGASLKMVSASESIQLRPQTGTDVGTFILQSSDEEEQDFADQLKDVYLKKHGHPKTKYA